MRDDLKFMRKPRWVDFALKKEPEPTPSRVLAFHDLLTLTDQIIIVRTIILQDEIRLSDVIGFGRSLSDTITLSDQLIADLHPPRLYANFADEIYIVDAIKSELDKSQPDGISLSDDLRVDVAQRLTDQLVLSDSIIVATQTVSQQQITLTDALTLTDSLQMTTQQAGGNIIIPDSYAVYNHNWQPVQADLSVWWDNDTGTSYNVYYSPPNPSNPRWVFLYFNNPFTLPRQINVYISGYAANKTLYIDGFYFGEWVTSATITPNQTGWYQVTLPQINALYVDEIEIYTDSNILGYIGIAEFRISAT
jgi:hypothetical protein